MDYTLAQAKRDFSNGYIRTANILRPGMHAGVWSIQLIGHSQSHTGFLVDARSHQPRHFKTLDAAFSALEQVGLKPEVFHAG